MAYEGDAVHEEPPGEERPAGHDPVAEILERAAQRARRLEELMGSRPANPAGRNGDGTGQLDDEAETHAGTHIGVWDYLHSRGLSDRQKRRLAPLFGKHLKRVFIQKYGFEPRTVVRFVGGADRRVCTYTEADRHLFDLVWTRHFARRDTAA